MNKFTTQDLAEDIKLFEGIKGFSPAYGIMALKSYYEHGNGLSVEENVEWLEFLIEVKKVIVKFVDKNIVDRKMRAEDNG